jgi:hypothetical protein
MRTVRSSRWLLSLLPLVTVLLVIRGQAASDGALIVAARNGDLAGVRAQITKRVDVNEQASDGSTRSALGGLPLGPRHDAGADRGRGEGGNSPTATASRRCFRRAAPAPRRSFRR